MWKQDLDYVPNQMKFVPMHKLKLSELGRMNLEEFKNSVKNEIVIVLDNIRSFHNTGSIFRSADAFRVKKIVLTGYTPTPPHREIRKTAIGAEESVEWQYEKEIVDAIHTLKKDGFSIVAVEQTSESIPLSEFTWKAGEKVALIFGNEVEGVQESVIALCDKAVEIPQYGTKHSLNVSVAAGVVLYGMMEKITFKE